jgi:hypothetical protein
MPSPGCGPDGTEQPASTEAHDLAYLVASEHAQTGLTRAADSYDCMIAEPNSLLVSGILRAPESCGQGILHPLTSPVDPSKPPVRRSRFRGLTW